MEVAINKPKNAEDFEEMCKHIYSVVFDDPTPKHYGRKGQEQYGKDILIQKNNIQDAEHRIAIQCKKVDKISFANKSGDSVIAEINKAESQVPPLDINHLIIATTFHTDQKLQDAVMQLSDERKALGKFTVSIDFWSDIESHIKKDPKGLLLRYKNDSEIPKVLLSGIKKAIDKEQYENAFEQLQEAESRLPIFNFQEKAKYYSYKISIYFAKHEWELALECINHAVDYDSKDEYLGIQVYLTLSHDLEKGSALLSDLKSENFDSPAILFNEYHELVLRGKALPAFEELSDELKNQFLLKQIYLGYYLRKADVNNFFAMYGYLSESEKGTVLLKCDYLNALTIQGFPSLIKAELDNLNERHLISWYMQQPRIERYLGIVLMLAYIRVGDREKAIDLFKNLERNCPEAINEQSLHLMFGLVHDDQKLYQLLIEKYLSDMIIKTSAILRPILSVIAHFNDINSLNTLKDPCSADDVILIDSYLHIINQSPIEELIIQLNTLIDSQADIGLILSLYCDVIFPNITEYNELLQQSENKILDCLNNLSIETKEQYSNLELDFYGKTYNYEKIYTILICKKTIDNFYDFYLIIKACFGLGRYQEAKEYLSKVKKIAPNEAQFFHLEVQMARDLLDYELMEQLLNKVPLEEKSAEGWVLDLIVSKREHSPQKYRKKIQSIPEDIQGEIVDIVHVAYLEIVSGFVEVGLKRIFHLLRSNFNNTEIQWQYFNVIVGENIHGYSLEECMKVPSMVQAGSEVTYRDAKGSSKTIIIDFEGDFPDLEGFKSPDDDFSLRVMNKKIGDKFAVHHKLQGEVFFEIIEIKSIYLAVFHLIQGKMDDPVSGVGGSVLSLSFPSNLSDLSGEALQESLQQVFQPLHVISERSRELDSQRYKDTLKLYEQHPVTLSMLAQLFQKNICHLVYFWPFDYKAPMAISNSKEINITENLNHIIVDSITLCELARIGSLESLNRYKVCITTQTESNLKQWDIKVKEMLNNGSSLFFHSNGVPFINDIANKETIVKIDENITEILELIENDCEVIAAYGVKDDEFSKMFELFCQKSSMGKKFISILSDEELSILRLCKEKEREAIFLTLDQRLNSIVSDIFKLPTIDFVKFLENIYKENDNHFLDISTELFFSNRSIRMEKTVGIDYMLQSTEKLQRFFSGLKLYNTFREKNPAYFSDVLKFHDCLVETYQQHPNTALAISYLVYIKDQMIDVKASSLMEERLKAVGININDIKVEDFTMQFAYRIPQIKFL